MGAQESKTLADQVKDKRDTGFRSPLKALKSPIKSPIKSPAKQDDEVVTSPVRQRAQELSPPTSPTVKSPPARSYAMRRRAPWVRQLQYDVQDKVLGNGTFARVCVAIDRDTKEKVAAKVIEKKCIPAEMKYVIEEECNTICRLDHPGVVKILSAYEDSTYMYLFMPLMHGGDMHGFIEEHGRLSEFTAFKVFAQLVEAIAHCHERNVIHRDIKLENILLADIGPNMRAVLVDFGFATEQRLDDPLLEDYPGSPAYAAPELTQGRPYRGRKSDIWALGVTLYTLVCGQYPFWHDDVDEMYYRIAYATPTFREQWALSGALRTLLLSMLKKNPEQRPSAEAIRDHPWMKAMRARLASQAQAQPQPTPSTAAKSRVVAEPHAVPYSARKPHNHKPASPFSLKGMARNLSSPLRIGQNRGKAAGRRLKF
jgi:serine/threonine protein kinase